MAEMDTLAAAHKALDDLWVPRGQDEDGDLTTFTAAERIRLFWPYQEGTRRHALPGQSRTSEIRERDEEEGERRAALRGVLLASMKDAPSEALLGALLDHFSPTPEGGGKE